MYCSRYSELEGKPSRAGKLSLSRDLLCLLLRTSYAMHHSSVTNEVDVQISANRCVYHPYLHITASTSHSLSGHCGESGEGCTTLTANLQNAGRPGMPPQNSMWILRPCVHPCSASSYGLLLLTVCRLSQWRRGKLEHSLRCSRQVRRLAAPSCI